MQVFGFVPSSKQILLIVVPSVTLGIGLAGYTLYRTFFSRGNIEIRGDEDLELPLALERDYGDYRATCREANVDASEYLNLLPDEFFHFNHNLSSRILIHLANHVSKVKAQRALVIGSSTAGFAFELSRHFVEVKGIESSFTKVVTSFQFQNSKSISYYFPLEGNHLTKRVTLNHVDIFKRFVNPLKNVDPLANVQIVKGDPDGRLSIQIGIFQVIILFVLNNLNHPEAVLSALYRFVEPQGLLFIVSDYNWTRSTNRHEGFPQPDVKTTFDFLKLILQKDFILESETHMPAVFPISLRSCTIHNYHVTAWRRLNVEEPSDDSTD